jgi:hypothetical protein
MNKKTWLMLGAVALVGGYMWYRYDKKEKAKKALASTPAVTPAV